MAAVDAAGELAALFPVARPVTIAGRAITLKPMGIAKAARIVEMAAPILELRDGTISFFEWIEEFPGEVNPLLVVASDLDPEWVAGLDAIDRADLATHLQELNAGFFAERLLPIMARKRRAANLWNGAGPIPFNSSSAPDTSAPGTTHPSKSSSTSEPSTVLNDVVDEPA